MYAHTACKQSHADKTVYIEITVRSSRWQSVNTESFQPLPPHTHSSPRRCACRHQERSLALQCLRCIPNMTGEHKVTAQMNFYCRRNEVDKQV